MPDARDPKALHQNALDAEKALEQLATGLAGAGADKKIVETVSKMADMTRQVVKVIGAAGAGEKTGQAPGDAAPGDQSQPPAGAAPQEAAPAEQAPPPEAQGPDQTGSRPSIASATQELHSEVRKRASARAA